MRRTWTSIAVRVMKTLLMSGEACRRRFHCLEELSISLVLYCRSAGVAMLDVGYIPRVKRREVLCSVGSMLILPRCRRRCKKHTTKTCTCTSKSRFEISCCIVVRRAACNRSISARCADSTTPVELRRASCVAASSQGVDARYHAAYRHDYLVLQSVFTSGRLLSQKISPLDHLQPSGPPAELQIYAIVRHSSTMHSILT